MRGDTLAMLESRAMCVTSNIRCMIRWVQEHQYSDAQVRHAGILQHVSFAFARLDLPLHQCTVRKRHSSLSIIEISC